MLGGNLLKFLDFPEMLTSRKKESRDGREVLVDFLRPNYQLSDGSLLNYAIRELNYESFTALLPLPTELKQQISPGIVARDGVSFCAKITDQANGNRPYPSLSCCLSKNLTINFLITAEPRSLSGLRLPIAGKFTKQNYGIEAEENNQTAPEVDEFYFRPTHDAFHNPQPCRKIFERETRYRGLHVVTAELADANGRIIFKDCIGVHIG